MTHDTAHPPFAPPVTRLSRRITTVMPRQRPSQRRHDLIVLGLASAFCALFASVIIINLP